MSAKCRSCGAPIVWSFPQGKGAKPMPLEVKEGGDRLLLEDGTNVGCATGEGTHQSHFATCPDAKRWRGEA